jgi:CHRD domain
MIKNLSTFLLIGCATIILASCTKEKEELALKNNQETSGLIAAVPEPKIPWPYTSIKRVSLVLQGAQMVPRLHIPTLGKLVVNLLSNKYVAYRLTTTDLEPGDFVTSAILYEGNPGVNGTPVAALPFYPWDNGVTKNLLLTDDQFNALNFLLTPPVIPTLPNSYFIITTNNHPGGLLRGQVIL